MQNGTITVLLRRNEKLTITTASEKLHRDTVHWLEERGVVIVDEFWGIKTYELLGDVIETLTAHCGGETPGSEPVYWLSGVPTLDDFGGMIADEFVDGKTTAPGGQWAIMTPTSWALHGVGTLGTGLGQRYKKQPSGRWIKVEG